MSTYISRILNTSIYKVQRFIARKILRKRVKKSRFLLFLRTVVAGEFILLTTVLYWHYYP